MIASRKSPGSTEKNVQKEEVGDRLKYGGTMFSCRVLVIVALMGLGSAVGVMAQDPNRPPPVSPLADLFADLGFPNVVEVEEEPGTFPAGSYTVRLLADLTNGRNPAAVSQFFLTTGGADVLLRLPPRALSIPQTPIDAPFFAQVPFALVVETRTGQRLVSERRPPVTKAPLVRIFRDPGALNSYLLTFGASAQGFPDMILQLNPDNPSQAVSLFSTLADDIAVTTLALTGEDAPWYDYSYNRCQYPTPPENRVPGCFREVSCTNYQGGRCVGEEKVDYYVCPTCFIPPITPEELMLRQCLARAETKKLACYYFLDRQEVECKASAREEAFDFCMVEENRIFRLRSISPFFPNETRILTIEECVQRRVGNNIRFNIDSVGISLPTQIGLGFGFRWTGPYQMCAEAREAAAPNCKEAFIRDRDNCDECNKLTCP
jgi:hypothetical protein